MPEKMTGRLYVNVPTDTLRALGRLSGEPHDKVREALDELLWSGGPYERPEDDSPLKHTGLRMTQAHYDGVRELAEKTGVNQSKWLRLAFHRAAYGKRGGK